MQRHDSMRGYFAYELYTQMKNNKEIYLITADLGYGMFNSIRDELPNQYINTGAAEQSALDIACGLSLEGKIPFVYSITPFLLYRGFETIRTYINHEKLNVKLIGSGRDDDYKHDGFSHFAGDDELLFDNKHQVGIFGNIKSLWPEDKEEIIELVKEMIESDRPYYLNLKR